MTKIAEKLAMTDRPTPLLVKRGTLRSSSAKPGSPLHSILLEREVLQMMNAELLFALCKARAARKQP